MNLSPSTIPAPSSASTARRNHLRQPVLSAPRIASFEQYRALVLGRQGISAKAVGL